MTDFLIQQVAFKGLMMGVPLILLGDFFRRWFGSQLNARIGLFIVVIAMLGLEAWLTVPSPAFNPLHLAFSAVLLFPIAYLAAPKTPARGGGAGDADGGGGGFFGGDGGGGDGGGGGGD